MLLNNSTNWKYDVPRNMNAFNLFKETIADGFLNNKPYIISSNIPDKQANEFLNHLINGADLFLTVDNIGNYKKLSEELCKEHVKILLSKRSDCMYKISILKYRKNFSDEKNEQYENIKNLIANDFDYYLEYLCDELFQLSIQVLDQVFSIADFEKHNLAYNAIINKGSNNKNYFILIRHLDNLKLSDENLNEAYHNSTNHSNYIPQKNHDRIIITTPFIQRLKYATYACLGAFGSGIFILISNKRR